MPQKPWLLESAARSVLADVDCGRIVDQARVAWAKRELKFAEECKRITSRRFDGWLAGATAEQAERFNNDMERK